MERVKHNARLVVELLCYQPEVLLIDDRDIIGKLSVDVYVSIALQGDLLAEDVGFTTLVVHVQALGGLINYKHQERYFAERGRWHARSYELPPALDEDERLELGAYLLRQHQPG